MFIPRLSLVRLFIYLFFVIKFTHAILFIESCGVADLITTCAGGRNRKVAAAFIKSDKSIEEIEKEMLNGQKLQGTTTSQEVFHFLSSRNMTQE